VAEAILHDFHGRIKYYTREGVQNLAESVIAYVRSKQIDRLERYIASAKKHNLFDMADNRFYDLLEELRKLRNRVHIQNEKNDFEPDERLAFSEARMRLAERVLEKLIRTMAQKYPRQHNHVRDFKLPWDPHFQG
jgi:hypothetical protein